MTDTNAAFMVSPRTENSRSYMGGIMNIVLPGAIVGDRMSVVASRMRLGAEPPPHVHHWHDEVIYVIDGELQIFCGEKTFDVTSGDFVFMPAKVAHAMKFRTNIHVIGFVSSSDGRSAGLDRYFVEMSKPATSMDLPEMGPTYGSIDLTRVHELGREHGVDFLSPEDARRLLPTYPGFGPSGAG